LIPLAKDRIRPGYQGLEDKNQAFVISARDPEKHVPGWTRDEFRFSDKIMRKTRS
jgi:hypothetical protein